jgi:hypothetical protein
MNDDATGIIEPVTISDVLELATWDRTRTNDELLGFIARREAIVNSDDE